MELGCQLPIKSHFKYKCDIVKASRDIDYCRASDLSNDCIGYWNGKSTSVVKEFWDPDLIELSSPNSTIGFFSTNVLFKNFMIVIQTLSLADSLGLLMTFMMTMTHMKER